MLDCNHWSQWLSVIISGISQYVNMYTLNTIQDIQDRQGRQQEAGTEWDVSCGNWTLQLTSSIKDFDYEEHIFILSCYWSKDMICFKILCRRCPASVLANYCRWWGGRRLSNCHWISRLSPRRQRAKSVRAVSPARGVWISVRETFITS